MKLIKKIHTIGITAILIALTLGGCEQYLDVVPEGDIRTIESSFEKKNTAMLFLYACYNHSPQVGGGSYITNPGVGAGDEYAVCEAFVNTGLGSPFRLALGSQNTASPMFSLWGEGSIGSFNHYEMIRNCNTFIANIDKVYNMSQEEKDKYKANAMAQKAYLYLELVKRYGPISLWDENIDVEASMEEMQIPRSHIDTCINEIVRLFDKSLELGIYDFLSQPSYEYGLLTKEAVYAYKADALLWAASPLFNGNSMYAGFVNKDGQALFSSTEDPEKWKRAAEAADEAIRFCTEVSDRELVKGYSQESSPLLNTIRDIQSSVMPIEYSSKEMLFGTWMLAEQTDIQRKLPRFSAEDPAHETPSFRDQGVFNPTIRMVELFYTENGLPIDKDASWSYNSRYSLGLESDYSWNNVVALNTDVLNLHLKREPRFYANIGFDGGIWQRRTVTGVEYMKMEPFRGGRHGHDDVTIDLNDFVNITGYWCKKRVALNNYTEKNQTSFSIFHPYPKMRLSEVYLMQAEAWNEYSGPSEKVYNALDKIRERAGVPDLVDAWNNFSNDPSYITTKEGLRDIVRKERMIELCFEGKRYDDLRRWKEAHLHLTGRVKGWEVTGAAGEQFYRNFSGPAEVGRRREFISPRDYLAPLNSYEVQKSNIVQNPGW